VMAGIRLGGEWRPLGHQSTALARRSMMAAVKAGGDFDGVAHREREARSVSFRTPGVPVMFRTGSRCSRQADSAPPRTAAEPGARHGWRAGGGVQPSTPVAVWEVPTGLDCGDPRCRR